MQCPFCGFADSKVTDSRAADDGIRRRRECLSCGERFTTYERLQRNDLLVVKRDGRREDFDREKLVAGLRRACAKRPVTAGVIEATADDIEALLHADGRSEVEADEIGQMVMDRLRAIDEIAYIRFASVYRRFQDIDEFRRELAAMESRPAVAPPQLPLLPEQEMSGLSRSATLPGFSTAQAHGDMRKRRGRGRKSA